MCRLQTHLQAAHGAHKHGDEHQRHARLQPGGGEQQRCWCERSYGRPRSSHQHAISHHSTQFQLASSHGAIMASTAAAPATAGLKRPGGERRRFGEGGGGQLATAGRHGTALAMRLTPVMLRGAPQLQRAEPPEPSPAPLTRFNQPKRRTPQLLRSTSQP